MEIDDNLIEQQEPTKRFTLKRAGRIAILVLLYLTVTVQAMTTTIFNVANQSIRNELRITEKTHTIFNFIFHTGEFISVICLMVLMRRPDRKSTVLFSVFATCCLVGLFQFTDSQMILMPSYFFVGFCVMAINVYIILWVDQFGIKKYKTLLKKTAITDNMNILFSEIDKEKYEEYKRIICEQFPIIYDDNNNLSDKVINYVNNLVDQIGKKENEKEKIHEFIEELKASGKTIKFLNNNIEDNNECKSKHR